tara:strand:+ start:4726 stop:8907 length:4182 start_codon:yes stop_codon:yes gene_type:complete
MALSKNIYKKAKEQFKKDLSSELGPFTSPVEIEFPDIYFKDNKGVFKGQEFTNLAFNENSLTTVSIPSLRLILEDPLAFTDPIDNLDKFGNIARAVRLNNFKEYGKNVDLGFGNGDSNNLIYKLATDYLKNTNKVSADDSISNPQQILAGSKSSVVQACLNSNKFNELIKNQLLDDVHTYECIVSQAFYKWHYENFVKNNSSSGYLSPANASDGSSISWTDIPLKQGQFKSFVALDGGPFNTGFPTVCLTFIVKKEEIKSSNSQNKVLDRAIEEISFRVDRKIETTKEKESVIVSIFNHKKDASQTPAFFDKVPLKVESTSNSTFRVCVGFHYGKLITSLKPQNQSPKRSVLDFVDYSIINLPAVGIAEKIIQSTNDQSTRDVAQEEIEKLSEVINNKNEAVQNGPALFFDLDEQRAGLDISNIEELVKKYEKTSNATTEAILKTQYSLNLENVSSTIREVYSTLILEYIVQRIADPRIAKSPLYEDEFIENLIFYYDNFNNLLAIGTAPRKATKKDPQITQTKFQQNNIPFEYELGEKNPLSNLNKQYSVISFEIEENGGMKTGLPGPLILVTDLYVDLLDKNFDNIKEKPNNSPSKEEVIEVKNGKKFIKGSLPRVIEFDDMGDLVFGSNKMFKTVLLKTSNLFFLSASEINLSSDLEGIYSLATKGLQLAQGTAQFLSGNETFSQIDARTVDDIQSFLERFHYPKLFVKPTIPKQKDTGAPDSGLVKARYDNSARPSALKKLKDFDPNDYKSISKMFNKEVLLIAAASSAEPGLCGLSDIVRNGDFNQIYNHLLSKFDWEDILAKFLLAELRKVSNIGPAKDVKDFANKVNACLTDQNVEQVLAAFANFVDFYKNFDLTTIANLPEIPKLNFEVPYIFILDFQKFGRKIIEDAIKEAIFAALQAILAIMLKQLCEVESQLDAGLQSLIYDKLNNKNKDEFGKKVPLEDSVRSLALNRPNADELGVKNVYVDLVPLLRASRIDSLENIFNGLLSLFPILRERIKNDLKRDPVVVIEEILDDLSQVTIAEETKSLLRGIAIAKTYNKVADYAATNLITTGVLSDINSINTFYGYLSSFINFDIINQDIVDTTIIAPDPCFINIGRLDVEELEVLQEFLTGLDGMSLSDYVDSALNDSLKRITDICSKLSAGAYNTSVALPNLISTNFKNSLQKSVEATVEPIVKTQQAAVDAFSNTSNRNELKDILSHLYIGGNITSPNASLNLTKLSLSSTTYAGALSDLNDKQSNITQIINIPSDDKIHKFFNESLNANFGGKSKIYSDQNNSTPFNQITRKKAGLNNVLPDIDRFFIFFTYWILSTSSIKDSDFTKVKDILSIEGEFEKFLNESFKNAEEIKKEANTNFDALVNEGGKNSNFFVANLQQMNKIIKSVKV